MNHKEAYIYVVKNIVANIGDRDLILRWKNQELEEMIYQELGKKVKFYVTRNRSRINNVDTFSDEILRGQRDKYYLFLDLKWNSNEADRYKSMGYFDMDDICWLIPKPRVFRFSGVESVGGAEDEYGNTIRTQSKVAVQFEGINSTITIGKNVVMPKSMLRIGSGVHVLIKDNCKLGSATIILGEGSCFTIDEKVLISGMHVFINIDSSVEIGKGTTMQTGKLRTGRNQIVRIGEDCMFSWDIVFIPHDGHLIWDVNTGECTNNTLGEKRESIVIGNHVWVGGETVFLPNTRVESGAVCGYRSLVKGRIPNNCVVAGSPAKVIKKNVAWSRANIAFDQGDYYKIKQEYRMLTKEETEKDYEI